MLKFIMKPTTGHRLLVVSNDEKPFAKVWTYPKSPAWYVSIKEKNPTKFVHKQKKMAFNNALEYVEKKASLRVYQAKWREEHPGYANKKSHEWRERQPPGRLNDIAKQWREKHQYDGAAKMRELRKKRRENK
jgi:hypothetical protein